MTIATRTHEYHDGKQRLEAVVAFDDAVRGPRPAVLVSHAWGGRDDFAIGKARALAELGYVGFALDVYGDARTGSGPEENQKLMAPFVEDRALLQRRMRCALDAARTVDGVDRARLAAIGFCFGGLCVLDLARTGADIAGVVSFHGLLIPPPNLKPGAAIRSRVLVLHGNDDPMVSEEHLIALRHDLTAAGCDWQLHVYGHTMHAFSNPAANDPKMGTVYEAKADRRSWASMQAFLAETFAK